MPNKPIIYRAEDLTKHLNQIKMAMDLEDYKRQEEAARRAKHAKFINSTLTEASKVGKRSAGVKTAPNPFKDSGRSKATKEALK